MSKCVRCEQPLQGLDYLQGFEFRFCPSCVKSTSFDSYDDFMDETEDELEDEDE